MKVKEILDGCSEWLPNQEYESVRPTVSILLPTFRRAKSGLFEAAVQSVLNQDFKNWELIIVDDASTDGTADLIAHFMRNDARISCIRHRYNVGLPAISEYEGYERSRGQYIAFIFDDNTWERDYLSRTINFMVRNQAKAAYGWVRSYYGTANEQFIELGKTTVEIGMNSLPFTNHIPNGAVILHREVIDNVGLYDPHVTLTRLCDWNLWKRVSKQYQFYETGVYAGAELGTSQKDSLGNQYKMDGWAVVEREACAATAELLPQNYKEVEIDSVSPSNTQFYIDLTGTFYNNFFEKNWYRKNESRMQISKISGRYILVIAASYDASMSLSFSRLAGASENLIIRFGNAGIPIYEVAKADAVVLVRNLVALDNFKRICEKLRIPCYWYIDDNFIELAKEYKSDQTIQLLKAPIEKNNCGKFSGIITSTQNLKAYFEKKRLNSNILCMEPCIEDIPLHHEPFVKSKVNEHVTLAYMGGPARDLIFLKTLLPAIADLAQERKIRLVIPERMNLSAYDEVENLQVVSIPFTLSLELALMQYGKYAPAILLHCGSANRNNEYKTENALINAVQLGAVLVASELPPFNDKAADGKYYLCAKNTEEDWFENLNRLLSDNTLRQKLLKRASEYCYKRYSKENAVKVLEEAFQGIAPAKYHETIFRLDEAMFDTLYVGTMTKSVYTAGTAKPSRSLTEVPLSFTGGLEKPKEYRIQCRIPTFSELGICFSSYGEVCGAVRIRIFCSEGQLREWVLDMDEYVHDNWTYMSFDPIENAMDQIYTVTMEFEYAEGSARIGVFEDASKRTFLYRLSNKLGRPIQVTDMLFADCRG